MKKKILNILITVLIITAFAGYRVYTSSDQERGGSSYETIQLVKQAKDKVGATDVERLITSMLPSGYAVYCKKQGFEDPELMVAAKNYNQRNSSKIESLINRIKKNGDLNSDEKAAIDKFAYAKVAGDINQKYISCDSLKGKINAGEWDY